ncbi:hypothetical protein ACE6H2_020313 [Prunus campanulata]
MDFNRVNFLRGNACQNHNEELGGCRPCDNPSLSPLMLSYFLPTNPAAIRFAKIQNPSITARLRLFKVQTISFCNLTA